MTVKASKRAWRQRLASARRRGTATRDRAGRGDVPVAVMRCPWPGGRSICLPTVAPSMPPRARQDASPSGEGGHGSRKIPVRTMSAAQEDTLAPWVQRVGVVASRGAASRPRGRPRDQGVTSPRTRPGPGVPTQPIPAHTDSQPIPAHTQGLPAMGAQRKALARRADALPGHPPHCHVGGRHRVAGRHAAALDRPKGCRPGAGQLKARHRVAELASPGWGLLLERHLRPGWIPGPAPPRPEAIPSPAATRAAMTPTREPRRRALPLLAGPPHARAHRGGGARSAATRRCRASRARSTRLASSPRGTGRPCAPHGSASMAKAYGRATPNRATPSWRPVTLRRTRQ
jgi:hypothetical protein